MIVSWIVFQRCRRYIRQLVEIFQPGLKRIEKTDHGNKYRIYGGDQVHILYLLSSILVSMISIFSAYQWSITSLVLEYFVFIYIPIFCIWYIIYMLLNVNTITCDWYFPELDCTYMTVPIWLYLYQSLYLNICRTNTARKKKIYLCELVIKLTFYFKRVKIF